MQKQNERWYKNIKGIQLNRFNILIINNLFKVEDAVSWVPSKDNN